MLRYATNITYGRQGQGIKEKVAKKKVEELALRWAVGVTDFAV